MLRAERGDPSAGSARASPPRSRAYAAPPRKYARRWSGRSTAPPAPGHGRYRRSRCRAARGPRDRAAVPTTSAARRDGADWLRSIFLSSFDFKAGLTKVSAASLMTEARDEMVVDHARGLHEGVDDGRSDEFESACGQLLR